ncbi:hypothetical protein ACFQYP_46685 [Nonomuraea antimicrobica]
MLYDRDGRHRGARRITEPRFVEPCVPVLSGLFDRGEDLRSYWTRMRAG